MGLPGFGTYSHPKTGGSGDRAFYGFDQRQLDLHLVDFDLRVRRSPPVAVHYADARLLPLVRTGHGLFSGGVFDADGFIDGLALRRGWRKDLKRHVDPGGLSASPKRASSSRVRKAYFGGYLFDHFGHFLLEGLARVVPGALDSTLPIIYFNPMGLRALPKYMNDVFSALNIDVQRLIFCDTPLQVDELVTHDTVYQIRGHVNAAVSARFKISSDLPHSRRPIYLSRTGLVGRRSIVREDELQESLVRLYDVEVVHPERLTLAEQFSKLASAETIVACAGSALHSLIFLEGRRRVFIITPSLRDALNYMLCDELFSSSTNYVSGAKQIGEARAWEADVECVLATLAACWNG